MVADEVSKCVSQRDESLRVGRVSSRRILISSILLDEDLQTSIV
jgi:hypothetical protein